MTGNRRSSTDQRDRAVKFRPPAAVLPLPNFAWRPLGPQETGRPSDFLPPKGIFRPARKSYFIGARS